jgi:pyruvate,water dikinase
LVELGIDSMSLNPDAVIKTTMTVLEVEKSQGRPSRSSPAPRSIGINAEGVVA